MLKLMSLFSEALEAADVPNECLGFTAHEYIAGGVPSWGVRSQPLLHIVIKKYEERVMTHRHLWPSHLCGPGRKT